MAAESCIERKGCIDVDKGYVPRRGKTPGQSDMVHLACVLVGGVPQT